MSERARNLAVGITVMAALMMLGGMILIFTGLPGALQSGYEIRIDADTTYDVQDGDPIYLRGMRVGRVTGRQFREGDPRKGVTITGRINRDIRLPSNVNAFFYAKGMVGGAFLTLWDEGPLRKDPSGREMDFLPTDRVFTLRGIYKGSSLLPEELTNGMRDLSKLAANLNALIAPEEQPAPAPTVLPTTTQAATTTVAAAPPGLKGTIVRLNRVLDDVHLVLGDMQNQTNFRTTLDNLAKVSAKAGDVMKAVQDFATEGSKAVNEAKGLVQQAGKTFETATTTIAKTGQGVEELTRKLIEDAEKISTLMSTINRVVMKIDEGEGSAGKLLNDPKLYNSLVEASQQMGKLMVDFRQLLEEWKKNGLPLRLK